ncbi:hypothetical protein [Nocardia transvalensis]|uniref:hypothetical protein n=1 Tax=Nocardia transvalensis TaxID=37333 RepID=UPI0018955417|nr:hypothetical protein [Nocardia transvalensis]MBF6329603.1 hypothetical protein [Nocardia transvalensis]
MFRVAVLIPSPPVLVPELCGGSPLADPAHRAAQVPVVREEVLAAGRILAEQASQWTVVGVGERAQALGPDAVGTFRGYGADLQVALSAAALAGGSADPSLPLAVLTGPSADPRLPLAALIGGWLRGQVAPEAVADARIVESDAPADHCLEVGATLRGELDARAEDCGVLVVADGAATLSTAAPGYLDLRAGELQERIDRALTAGDRDEIARLDAGLCAELDVSGRAAYQVLAGLFGDAAPTVETRYQAAPFGVGYQVSVWHPGGGA